MLQKIGPRNLRKIANIANELKKDGYETEANNLFESIKNYRNNLLNEDSYTPNDQYMREAGIKDVFIKIREFVVLNSKEAYKFVSERMGESIKVFIRRIALELAKIIYKSIGKEISETIDFNDLKEAIFIALKKVDWKDVLIKAVLLFKRNGWLLGLELLSFYVIEKYLLKYIAQAMNIEEDRLLELYKTFNIEGLVVRPMIKNVFGNFPAKADKNKSPTIEISPSVDDFESYPDDEPEELPEIEDDLEDASVRRWRAPENDRRQPPIPHVIFRK